MAERLNNPTTPNGALLANSHATTQTLSDTANNEHNMNSTKLEIEHVVDSECPISSLVGALNPPMARFSFIGKMSFTLEAFTKRVT
jgi:hypothetical protein